MNLLMLKGFVNIEEQLYSASSGSNYLKGSLKSETQSFDNHRSINIIYFTIFDKKLIDRIMQNKKLLNCEAILLGYAGTSISSSSRSMFIQIDKMITDNDLDGENELTVLNNVLWRVFG